MASDIDQAKHEVRDRVWTLLAREAAAPPGVHGHIPSFVGAQQAAERLAEMEGWRRARVLKSNPDKAQLPVRVRALNEGKLLYMAVPQLATPKPFYLLGPAQLTAPIATVATSAGAAEVARTIEVDDMQPGDLIVCSSVAVNRQGVRIGKAPGTPTVLSKLRRIVDRSEVWYAPFGQRQVSVQRRTRGQISRTASSDPRRRQRPRRR